MSEDWIHSHLPAATRSISRTMPPRPVIVIAGTGNGTGERSSKVDGKDTATDPTIVQVLEVILRACIDTPSWNVTS